MKRPFILRIAPASLAGRILYRFYRPVSDDYLPLYEAANLKYAPDAVMTLPKTREYMYDMIAMTGVFESSISRRIVGVAKACGGLFVDVGANVGYHSLLWLSGSESSRAICLEPSPHVFRYLEDNIRMNEFQQQTVLLRSAASDRCGAVQFSTLGDEPTGWGRITQGEDSFHTLTVPTVKLDDVIPPGERVELLKCDVEGAESLVLLGAERLLADRCIKRICIEVNKPGAATMGLSGVNVLHHLEQRGFELSQLTGSPSSEGITDWWGQIAA